MADLDLLLSRDAVFKETCAASVPIPIDQSPIYFAQAKFAT